MRDIGMSPDYRSGYGEERCAICNRRITASRQVETCVECNREVCYAHGTYTDNGFVCDECWDGWDD